jgi:mannitol/fructose-specific phosphotransferase system IIA component (Ntr-type)
VLEQHLTEDRVLFADPVDWREAVREAARPLVEDGSVEPRYVEKVLEAIAAPGGTYMDLGFGITLAHSRPEEGVNRTALSLLLPERTLHLADDESHPVNAVFVLAATGTQDHQQTMAELARLLMDAGSRTALLAARSYPELTKILQPAG